MPDYRTMYDRDYLAHFDLPKGRDVVVKIEKVKGGEFDKKGSKKKEKKPVVFFEGKEKGLALCKTTGKTIAQLYGNFTEKWIGKEIALYVTQCEAFGEMVDCIRVRPQVPQRKATTQKQTGAIAAPEPPPPEEQPAFDADTGEVVSDPMAADAEPPADQVVRP